MEERIVKLNYYDSMEEAMLDQSILEENDISTSIHDTAGGNILPMLSEINEGISVMVFEKDKVRATEILNAYHQQDV